MDFGVHYEHAKQSILSALRCVPSGLHIERLVNLTGHSSLLIEYVLYKAIRSGCATRTLDRKFVLGKPSRSSDELLMSLLFLGEFPMEEITKLMGMSRCALLTMIEGKKQIEVFQRDGREMLRGPLQIMHVLGRIAFGPKTKAMLDELFPNAEHELHRALQALFAEQRIFFDIDTKEWKIRKTNDPITGLPGISAVITPPTSPSPRVC